jgi:membrane carboxypeptidase/penicillin-binding protein
MAALPIWIDFMKVAILGHPNEDFAPPPDLPKVANKMDTPDVRHGDAEAH